MAFSAAFAGTARAGDLPRYKLQVGEKLVYRQSTLITMPNQPAQDRTDDFNVYVVGQNADGSWRVVEAAAALGSRAQAAVYNVSADGQVEMTQGEYDVGLASLFPRLPDDQGQLATGWDDQTADHSRMLHLVAGPTTQPSDTMSIVSTATGGFAAISQAGPVRTYQFDVRRGLVSGFTRPAKPAAGVTQSPGATQLISVEQISPDATRALADSATAYLNSMAHYTTALDGSIAEQTAAQADFTKTTRTFAVLAAGVTDAANNANVNFMVPDPPSGAQAFQQAPRWSAMGFDGKMHSSEEFRGKVVVMEFWARTCGFCIMEMPQLVQLSQDFKDKPVVVVGMSVDPDDRDGQAVVDAMRPPFLNIHAAGIWRQFPIDISPITFIFDKNGMIRGHLRGYDALGYAEIAAQVKPLLEAPTRILPASGFIPAVITFTPLPPKELPAKLKAIVAENAKSYDKVAWISYHSEQHDLNLLQGNRTFDRTNDVIRKSPYRYILAATSQHDAGGNEVAGQSVTIKSVLGPQYFGMVMIPKADPTRPVDPRVRNPLPQCVGFDSIDNLPPRMTSLLGLSEGGDALLTCGYGIDNETVSDFFAKRSNGEFDIEETNDPSGHFFTVTYGPPTLPGAKKQVIASLIFDANNGFLLTHYRLFMMDKIMREATVKISQLSDGSGGTIPFPAEIYRTNYDNFKPSSQLTIKLSNVKYEPDIDKGQFTMSALDVADGTTVMYEGTNGTVQERTWSKGALSPADGVPGPP